MPFAPDECYVGMIAYFKINHLGRHPRIRNTNSTRDNKPRPFVCYAQADGELYWTCFTTSHQPNRKVVSRQWLRVPPGRDIAAIGDLIIWDGRSSFAGPAQAFAECSKKHDRWKGLYRPLLMPPGVEQVRRAVQIRGGLLPPIANASAVKPLATAA